MPFATLLCENQQSQLQRLLESISDRQEGTFQKLATAFVEHATAVARARRAAATVPRIMTGPRPVVVEVPPSRAQSHPQDPEAPPARASPRAPSVAEGQAAAPDAGNVQSERPDDGQRQETTDPRARKSHRRDS